MGELPFRRTFTAAVIEIGSNLSFLPVWARDDKPDLAASSVTKIQRLLLDISENFEPFRFMFAASGGPEDVIRLRHRFYASAHDAILGEARSFIEIFWFHVDAEGHKETVDKALGQIKCSPAERSRSLKVMTYSSGLDAKKVVSEWHRAKSGISELLMDEWLAAFRPLEARAFREFAHAKVAGAQKPATALEPKSKQKNAGKSQRGRKAVSTPAADRALIDHWYSAKNAGQKKATFEEGRGLDAGAVAKAMARLREAERRMSRKSIDAH